MLKNFVYYICYPLIFGRDENENFLFKSFSFLNNTAYLYDRILDKDQIKEVLDYRCALARKYNLISFISLILFYFLFLAYDFNLLILGLFIIAYFGIKLILSNYFTEIYARRVKAQFGAYKLTTFEPKLSSEKQSFFFEEMLKKAGVTLLILITYVAGAFALCHSIKNQIANKHFSFAMRACDFYSTIYPKTKQFYNLRAIVKYTQKDYKGSLEDYKKVFDKSSGRFTKQDYVKFSNLLLLERNLTNAQNALYVFDEYLTKKHLSVTDKAKMLWIKSMFSLNAGISEYVLSDYDNLLESLKKNDMENRFYILSDKAYMLYLMGQYNDSLYLYDMLIKWAQSKSPNFDNDLQRLYVERGYNRLKLNDKFNADKDFLDSQLTEGEIADREPVATEGKFVIEDF